jgi:predicted GIY-YIG superfamily endonuclease
MITVYVLQSIKDNATYVGMAKDAFTRLVEHNNGKNYNLILFYEKKVSQKSHRQMIYSTFV